MTFNNYSVERDQNSYSAVYSSCDVESGCHSLVKNVTKDGKIGLEPRLIIDLKPNSEFHKKGIVKTGQNANSPHCQVLFSNIFL